MWWWLWTACAPSPDPRAAWLVDALARDNLAWSTRDPSLLATKYARMASDPYDMMRGTAGVYLRDQSRPGTGRAPTAFLTVAEAGGVLLAGDPHPENFGTYAVDGEWVVDLNDLDGAAHGPWLWDLRRAAVGLGLIAAGAGCEDPCVEDAADALGRAYGAQIAARASGGAPMDTAARFDHGLWFADLIATAEAADDGLGEIAPPSRFGRSILRTDGLDERGQGAIGLTPDEDALLQALIATWADRRPGLRVLDAVRRFGVGIASLPALRFGVLIDDGDDSPADDALIQIREVVDPPPVPGLRAPLPAVYASGAERVVATTRALWAHPNADPWLAGVSVAPATFKVVGWTEQQARFDHVTLSERLAATSPEDEALIALADFVGRRLADAHAGALNAEGRPGLTAIAADVDGRSDLLGAELAAGARADVNTVVADTERLRAALDRLGPTLGAEATLAQGSTP